MGTFLSLSKALSLLGLHVSEVVVFLAGIGLTVGIIGEMKTPTGFPILWPRLHAFEMLVLIGVMFELFGDGGVFFFSERLQAFSDAEVRQALDNSTDATNRASSAEKDLGTEKAALVKAEGQVANLNKEAERLRKEAEDERLARVRLYEMVQPRAITDREKIKLVTAQLRGRALSFPHTIVNMASILDAEAVVFATQIGNILEAAGIAVNGSLIGRRLRVGMRQFGVSITGPTNDEQLMRAILSTVCQAAKTDCHAEWGPQYTELQIEVDSKPIPGIVVVPAKPKQ